MGKYMQPNGMSQGPSGKPRLQEARARLGRWAWAVPPGRDPMDIGPGLSQATEGKPHIPEWDLSAVLFCSDTAVLPGGTVSADMISPWTDWPSSPST